MSLKGHGNCPIVIFYYVMESTSLMTYKLLEINCESDVWLSPNMENVFCVVVQRGWTAL